MVKASTGKFLDLISYFLIASYHTEAVFCQTNHFFQPDLVILFDQLCLFSLLQWQYMLTVLSCVWFLFLYLAHHLPMYLQWNCENTRSVSHSEMKSCKRLNRDRVPIRRNRHPPGAVGHQFATDSVVPKAQIQGRVNLG